MLFVTTRSQGIDPTRFVTLLGRYFQIRDDYQNLTSNEVCRVTLLYCPQKIYVAD